MDHEKKVSIIRKKLHEFIDSPEFMQVAFNLRFKRPDVFEIGDLLSIEVNQYEFIQIRGRSNGKGGFTECKKQFKIDDKNDSNTVRKKA